MLLHHLDKVKADDMLLLDWGRSRFLSIVFAQGQRDRILCAFKERLVVHGQGVCRKWKKEWIVSFALTKKDRRKLAAFRHMMDTTIVYNLVKVKREKEVLCTSLTNTEKYVHEDFR